MGAVFLVGKDLTRRKSLVQNRPMAKVTSKLQLTLPKKIAEQYGIRPGDVVELEPAGDVVRLVPSSARRTTSPRIPVEERLRLFEEASERQRRRDAQFRAKHGYGRLGASPADRGWTREELYEERLDRGRR